MKLRSLLSASLLYGLSDMTVLFVSGFLLLPLYVRALNQAEFGVYVVVRANTELLGYLLYLGVPSALARLYFDYRKTETQIDYIGTISLAFLTVVLAGGGLIWLFGASVWDVLAPKTSAWPYLWFCFGTAVLSFYGLIGTTWLRLEEAVRSVVTLQVATAMLLVIFVWLALVVLGGGLVSLLAVLLLSNLPPALVVIVRLSRGFRRFLPFEAVSKTLYLGLPIFLSYLSNFALNRINLFILQHWAAIETVAVFGLATQLASLVTVASMSFGKAVQPTVFRSEPAELANILNRTVPVYIAIMTIAAMLLALYVDDLMTIIAPSSYSAAYDIVLFLIFANLISSFSLISDTTLMYFKKPNVSLVAALLGGVASTLIGLSLVPVLGAIGAAIALVIAFALKTLMSQLFANRYVATETVRLMIGACVMAAGMLIAVRWLHGMALPFWLSVGVKSAGIAVVIATGYVIWIGRRKVMTMS